MLLGLENPVFVLLEKFSFVGVSWVKSSRRSMSDLLVAQCRLSGVIVCPWLWELAFLRPSSTKSLQEAFWKAVMVLKMSGKTISRSILLHRVLTCHPKP